MNYIYYIGQAFGLVAFILGVLSYQTSSTKKLLFLQTSTSAVFVLHYLMIGATSGFALNIVSLIRNFSYCHKDKKIFSNKFMPYVFALIMVILGIFSWIDLYSLFLIAGLAINSVCMSFKDSQNIRKSILVTSPLVIIYNIHVLSVAGIIYESIAIISSLIGIIRFHREKTEG